MKIMSKTGINIDPWGTSPVIGLQADFVPLPSGPSYFSSHPAHTSWESYRTQWQKSYCSFGPPCLLLSPQLPGQSFHHRNLSASPWWIHTDCSWWLPSLFRHLEMVSRISCSIIFLGVKLSFTSLPFSGCSFLKLEVTFAFLCGHLQLPWSIKEQVVLLFCSISHIGKGACLQMDSDSSANRKI